MDSDPDVIHLRIKSFKDVELDVPSGSVVAHLKQQVRAALGVDSPTITPSSSSSYEEQNNSTERYLRLICKGRLLLPDDHPIQDFNVQDGDVVHAVLAPIKRHNNKPIVAPSSEPVPTIANLESSSPIAVNTSSSNSSSSSNNNNSRVQQSPASGTQTSHRRRRRTLRDDQPPRGIRVGPGGRVTRVPLSDRDADGNNSDHSYDYDNSGGDDDDDDEEDDIYDEELGRLVPRERLGFDRLRGPRRSRNSSSTTTNTTTTTTTSNSAASTGMSRTEIAVIRAYFSRHVDQYIARHPTSHQDEPDPFRRRLLQEEDWMAAQGPLSEFRLNLNANSTLRQLATSLPSAANLNRNRNGGGRITMVGTDRDFLWGFMLGFMVGFAMMVWVWMPSIPHKQKLGILTGITFQILLYNPPEELDEFDTSNELP